MIALSASPLLVVKVADRPLPDDLTDQASLFICLLAGYLGGFRPFIGQS
jgi:hypothetical protein